MTFRGTIEDLQNAVVVDRDGDKLGKVAQVYLDNDTRDPSWVTVKTGLLGTNESFVPLDKSDYADGTITVPFEKSYIKDAPPIAEDGELVREQEDELYRYYGISGGTGGQQDPGVDPTGSRDHAGRQDTPGPRNTAGRQDAPGARDDQDQHRPDVTDGGGVTLHEEQAHVGTEKVQTGRVRLRKHVVTDTEQVEVPVQREELVLEREPADGRAGGTLSEEEVDVTLTEERPVVEKETVATEDVRLGKRAVTDEETVRTDLSHEEVEMDEEALDGRPGRRARGDEPGTAGPGRGV